ncbi:MAG: uroporphyrinogen decarboxylase family protein [Desulfobacterales bacterium]|nr:uroporphyrinogen decarboxylase family protein [Desulfobacterales bacterium]
MPTETMTPRERWLAVLRRQKPDRTPTDYWGTPETGQKLKRHFGGVSLHKALERMHVDYLVTVAPRYVGPRLAPHRDVFGIQYRDIDYGSGVYPEAFTHPLARFGSVEEIEAGYRWPDPDWWDYSGIADRLRGCEDRAVRGGGSEPFLTYKYLRGDEQAMIDLLENPEMVEYCLGKLFDLAYHNTLRIYEAAPGRVDLSYVAEDMGAQNDLMIAPRQIRRFLLPGMKRMIELAHGAGVVVFYHNDGNITRILPELVDLGMDVLNPIQWRAEGMDRQMLKRQYGERIIFHGAVDNQYTLPFGTEEEVRQEVRDNLRILGAGGGYILAPCHNIQPVTPVENIIAMYETAYREG